MILTANEIKFIAAIQIHPESSRWEMFKVLADVFALTEDERRELPGKLQKLGIAK